MKKKTFAVSTSVSVLVILLLSITLILGNAYAEDSTDTSIEPYVKSVDVQQEVDGKWESTTTLNAGHSVSITYNYNIPAGELSSDTHTLTYQYPKGIITENLSGEITNSSGEEIGTYTISDSGLETITFNSDINLANGLSGSIQTYAGVANPETTEEGSSEEGSLQFPGSSTTYKVIPTSSQSDLTTTKSATVSNNETAQDSTKVVSYSVEVGSTNGSGNGDVTVTDTLTPQTGLNASYNSDSISVEKVSADGTVTDVTGYTTSVSSDGKTLTINGLPALNKGEKYEIHYTVNSSFTSGTSINRNLANTVTASSPSASSTADANVTIKQPLIQNKSGNNQAFTDHINKYINWTIHLNDAGEDLKGAVLDDTLPDGMTLAPGTSIVISTSGGTTLQKATSFPITINTDSTEPMVVTFKTTYGTAKEGDNVNNTATLKFNDKTYSTTGVGVISNQNVDKSGELDGYNNGIISVKWTTKNYYTNPSDPIVITDTIGEVPGYSGIHTGDAAEIEKAIEASFTLYVEDSDGKISTVGWNEDGLVCKIVSDSGTIQSFKVEITYPSGMKPVASTFSYDTSVNVSSLYGGSMITIPNTATYNNKSVTPQVNYTVPYPLSKGVSTGGTPNSNDGPQGWDTNINSSVWGTTVLNNTDHVTYDSTDGYLDYAISFPVDKDGTITITDTINAYVDYDEFYKYLSGNFVGLKSGESLYWLTSELIQQINLESITHPTDDSSTLTFSVNATEMLKDSGNVPMQATILYVVPIKDDPFWNDASNQAKTYTNNVTMGDMDATTSTTVYRPKVGDIVKDGTNVYTATYTVVVNATDSSQAKDGKVTVYDELTQPSGVEAQLEPNSVTLYNYDESAENGEGTTVSPVDFSTSYDDSNDMLTCTVPAGKVYILTYKYKVLTVSNAKTTMKNEFSLGTPPSSASTSSSTNGGSTTVTIPASTHGTGDQYDFDLKIFKSQEGNDQVRLSGVAFTLEQYDLSTKSWVKVSGAEQEYVTDEQGEIEFNDASLFKANTLYRFVEQNVPEGYGIPEGKDNSTEFVIMTQGESEEEAESAMESAGYPAEDLADASFRPYLGGHIYIENTLNGLQAQKKWLDANGDVLPDDKTPESSVTFELMQSLNSDGSDATVLAGSQKVADASNDWKVTWSGLDQTNSDGAKYYYFVKEVGDATNWTVSYTNNDGTPTGIVTVTNQMNEVAVNLPKTGDGGTVNLALAAGVLFVLAAFAFIKSRKAA